MHTHCISWHHTTRMSGMQYDQTRFDVRGRPQCALGVVANSEEEGWGWCMLSQSYKLPNIRDGLFFLDVLLDLRKLPRPYLRHHMGAVRVGLRRFLTRRVFVSLDKGFPGVRRAWTQVRRAWEVKEGRGAGAEKRRGESYDGVSWGNAESEACEVGIVRGTGGAERVTRSPPNDRSVRGSEQKSVELRRVSWGNAGSKASEVVGVVRGACAWRVRGVCGACDVCAVRVRCVCGACVVCARFVCEADRAKAEG